MHGSLQFITFDPEGATEELTSLDGQFKSWIVNLKNSKKHLINTFYDEKGPQKFKPNCSWNALSIKVKLASGFDSSWV